jgi:hypothetical protein
MIIEVKFDKGYGNERFYALNDNARTLLELCGRRSLTREQLLLCQKAGWTVTIIQPTYVLE